MADCLCKDIVVPAEKPRAVILIATKAAAAATAQRQCRRMFFQSVNQTHSARVCVCGVLTKTMANAYMRGTHRR